MANSIEISNSHNNITKSNNINNNKITINNDNNNNDKSETARGAFGWEKITETLYMPVIIRDGCRYIAIRIVEKELIGKYQLLPAEVFGCINIRSFFVNELEANLLTTINSKHCDHKYGFQPFASLSDMIVSVKDVKELARFLNYAQKLFILHQGCNDKLGVAKLFTNSTNIYPLVPFITKKLNDISAKFVPQVAVEPFIYDATSAAQMLPTAWDIAYLKMVSIYAKQDHSALSVRDCLLHLPDLTDCITNQPISFEIWSPIGE